MAGTIEKSGNERYCDKLKRVKAFKEQEFDKYKKEYNKLLEEKDYKLLKTYLDKEIPNRQNFLELLTMFINKIEKECPKDNVSEFTCYSVCVPVYDYLKGMYDLNVPDNFVETKAETTIKEVKQ